MRADLDEFVARFHAENRHDRTPTWSPDAPAGTYHGCASGRDTQPSMNDAKNVSAVVPSWARM